MFSLSSNHLLDLRATSIETRAGYACEFRILVPSFIRKEQGKEGQDDLFRRTTVSSKHQKLNPTRNPRFTPPTQRFSVATVAVRLRKNISRLYKSGEEQNLLMSLILVNLYGGSSQTWIQSSLKEVGSAHGRRRIVPIIGFSGESFRQGNQCSCCRI